MANAVEEVQEVEDAIKMSSKLTRSINNIIDGKKITLISQDDDEDRYKFCKGYELVVGVNDKDKKLQ